MPQYGVAQYPGPPGAPPGLALPDDVAGAEPEDELVAVIAVPFGETNHHRAPKALTPCPLVSPAAWSCANMYSGCLLYVTCFEPSERVVVPSMFPVTPAPACALPDTVSGGQAAAHAPLQLDWPFLSARNRYSDLPWPSTR